MAVARVCRRIGAQSYRYTERIGLHSARNTWHRLSHSSGLLFPCHIATPIRHKLTKTRAKSARHNHWRNTSEAKNLYKCTFSVATKRALLNNTILRSRSYIAMEFPVWLWLHVQRWLWLLLHGGRVQKIRPNSSLMLCDGCDLNLISLCRAEQAIIAHLCLHSRYYRLHCYSVYGARGFHSRPARHKQMRFYLTLKGRWRAPNVWWVTSNRWAPEAGERKETPIIRELCEKCGYCTTMNRVPNRRKPTATSKSSTPTSRIVRNPCNIEMCTATHSKKAFSFGTRLLTATVTLDDGMLWLLAAVVRTKSGRRIFKIAINNGSAQANPRRASILCACRVYGWRAEWISAAVATQSVQVRELLSHSYSANKIARESGRTHKYARVCST